MSVTDLLIERNRQIRADLPEMLRLRIHRALSWCQRAQQDQDDPDAQFIFYWVAFNAAYADEAAEAMRIGARSRFEDFFGKIVRHDADGEIHEAIWQQFARSIEALLTNRYVFQPFWSYQNGVAGSENWADRFERSQRSVRSALFRKDTVVVLSILFDRLYVLRNQLIHGGATWGSAVNRRQVKDGAQILGFLLPLFIKIMMEHPEEAWGNPHYPVVRD